MSKFVKTYYPSTGLNYIEDPDLILASKILTVHREGKSYDPGSGNRAFLYSSPNGRIYFPNAFEPNETVRVWWEAEGGVIPVCDPVTVDLVMPSGVEGVYYLYDKVLAGTSPFSLTINEKPAWMEAVIYSDHIQFYGTPTAAGSYHLDILITNCSGGGSLPFVTDVLIYSPPPPEPVEGSTFKASVSAATAKITGLFGTTFTVSSGTFPVTTGTSALGAFTPFFGSLKVSTNIMLFTYHLVLKKNGVIIETLLLVALTTGMRTFSPTLWSATDIMEIELTS